jgi:DNA-binding MarR family transcriptional regulator
VPAPDAFDDERLTMVGLLFEATSGLGLSLERQLERDAGLSMQWFEVLLRLARTPGERLRMSDLAAQTTLTPSGLTRAVDRLEQAGFVTRELCPSDRRGSFAVLTAAGRQRIGDAVPGHLARVESLFGSALAADERRAFVELIRKLRDAVNPDAARASSADTVAPR